MSDIEVLNFQGRDVSITKKDGTVQTGFFCMFIPDYDNDPEVSEVVLEIGRNNKSLWGIEVPDIDHIEVLEE